MKKKLFATVLAALMLLPIAALAADTPSDSAADKIDAAYPALFTAAELPLDYQSPISRAAFSMLAFEAFRKINGGIFPQMQAKNIFSDLGDKPEDIYVVMLYGMGVVNGVAADSFAPRRAVTLEEACTILTRAKLRQDPDILPSLQSAESALEGIDGAETVSAWAKESVGYLLSAGILSLPSGSITPGAALTTEDAMVLCTAYTSR